ncbi:MAG: prepilin-type N-terminal cleavage/methylation domain-containing protein [Desulfobacterales bacterium]|nr:MAG: prepilin-type N-terminal cleavage/methylation domain-containing protein [Desulfobacterales bacterium]
MTLVRLKLIKRIQLKADVFNDRRIIPREVDCADQSTLSCGRLGQGGLTLLELMIVIAIIGILSGIAVPLYFGQIEKARVIKAVAELENLQMEIGNFEIDHYRLPESLEEVKSGRLIDPWGNPYQYLNFATLEDNPEDEEAEDPGKTPKGKAIGKDKKDGAGVENSIRLDPLNDPLNSDYDLYSCGKDGKTAPSVDDPLSQDDVVRGRDGAYIGPVSQFKP